jgi:hypothetical protein
LQVFLELLLFLALQLSMSLAVAPGEVLVLARLLGACSLSPSRSFSLAIARSSSCHWPVNFPGAPGRVP